MGKKSGRRGMKRISAPSSWDIARKEARFITKPSPGSHPIANSYSLSVVLRNLLGMVETQKEVMQVLTRGDVLVDGVPRHDPGFPVGLFDVVTIPAEGKSFRLVPSPDGLVPTDIVSTESGVKLCRVRSKVKTTGGRIQFGFHDGRSMLDDKLTVSCGDSVVMKVPDQAVVESVKLAKGTMGIVVSGDRAGQVGRIIGVKKGTSTREKMVELSLPSGETELPERLVFPVGTDKPAVEVQVKT
ncbi:MAG TPA: 30S ribosomal protein S4e [Nitrososphaerales archaeon]|nr:30S ribosomal protein S4e [Nitrososphaerales archaeon]